MCMYKIHIHIYIYIYIRTDKHTYIHTYIYMYGFGALGNRVSVLEVAFGSTVQQWLPPNCEQLEYHR